MPIVPALRQFTYNGRTVKRGDQVDMTPLDASIHARKGNVSITRQINTRTLRAEPSSSSDPDIDAPKPRRRYRRRDMQAEAE